MHIAENSQKRLSYFQILLAEISGYTARSALAPSVTPEDLGAIAERCRGLLANVEKLLQDVNADLNLENVAPPPSRGIHAPDPPQPAPILAPSPLPGPTAPENTGVGS